MAAEILIPKDKDPTDHFGNITFLEAIEIFNAYRGKIVAENELINQRLSWMLWIQSILFAIWGSLALNVKSINSGVLIYVVLIIISVFGMLVSYVSVVSVRAAESEIEDIIDQYKLKYRLLYYNDRMPHIVCGKKITATGLLFGSMVSLLFVFLHIVAIVYVIIARVI